MQIRTFAVGLLVTATTTTGILAHANEAQTDTLEEVVVTSRKRVESVVEVPTSISVFGAETLENLRIESVTDYVSKMPSVAYTYGQGSSGMADSRTISIRGISGQNVTGFYIDDVPVPDSVDPRVVDLERIEALKGPQGTLYGGGSMGGNVRLISRKPSLDKNEFDVMGQLGRTTGSGDDDYGGSGIANVVLAEDKLALRVVGFGQKDSGYINRRFPNASGGFTVDGDNGAVQTYGGSATLLWQATDAFDINAKVMYQKMEGDGHPTVYMPVTQGFQPRSYTIAREADQPESYVREYFLPSLTLSYAWPGATLSSTTAYFDDQQFDVMDVTEGVGSVVWNSGGYVGYDYPEGAPIGMHWSTRQKSITQETRLLFEPIGRLSGTVGFFYYKNWSRYPVRQERGFFFPAPGLADQGLAATDESIFSKSNVDQKQYALFTELYYDLTDALKLTAGARYYRHQTTISGFTDGVAYVGTPLFIFGTRNEWYETTPWESGVSPKVALQYEAAPGTNVYASASKGFRPGGGNTPLAAFCSGGPGSIEELGYTLDSVLSYDSDTVWSYELGVKRQSGNMFFAAAAYRIKWDGIQQSVSVPKCVLSFTANSGAAEINGAEIEATFAPFAGLELRAALGYNDAEITDQGNGVAPAGSRILQVPDWTGSASIAYEWAGGFSGWRPFLSADYSYAGSALSGNVDASRPLVRDAYSLVNGRVGIRKDNLEVSLYGENLTDEMVQLGDPGEGGAAPRDPGDPTYPLLRGVVSRPLSFGLQARYKF